MDLDLTHQLLLGSASLQRRLLNDLRGCYLFVVALDELIALGKASLAQEFAFDVLPESHLAILVLELFLDNLGASILLGMQVCLAVAVLTCRQRLGSLTTGAWTLRLCCELQVVVVIVH